jgi:hypothetical protein
MQIVYKARKDPATNLFNYPGFPSLSPSFSKILHPVPFDPSTFTIYHQAKEPFEKSDHFQKLLSSSDKKGPNEEQSQKGELWGRLMFLNCLYQGSYVTKGDQKTCMPSGVGVALFETGELYLGEFENGLFEGKGLMVFCKGGQIEGNFHKNKIQGEAVLRLLNGTCAILNFKNGTLEGPSLWVTFTSDPRIDGIEYIEETWSPENDLGMIEWTMREYKNGILIQNIGNGRGLPPECTKFLSLLI